jgi:hypothetical protein
LRLVCASRWEWDEGREEKNPAKYNEYLDADTAIQYSEEGQRISTANERTEVWRRRTSGVEDEDIE